MWHHQYIVLVLSISIITHLASLIIRGTNTIFGQTEHDVNDILILRVNNCEIVAQLIVPELISGVTLSLNDNAFTTNKSNASCTPDHVALFLPPPYQSHLPAQLWLVKYDSRGINYTVKEIPHQRVRLKHLIRIDNRTTKIMVDVDDYVPFPFPTRLRGMRISSAQFFFDHIQQLAYIITKSESEVMPTICHVFTVRIWEPEMTSPKIRYHFNFVMDAQFKNAAFLSNPIKQLLFYSQPDSDRFFYMDYSSVLINLRNGIDSADDEHSVFNFSRAMKSDYFPQMFKLLAPNMGDLYLIGYNMSSWQRYIDRVRTQFFFVLLGWNRCVITREDDFEKSLSCQRDKPRNAIQEWSRNESEWIEAGHNGRCGEPHH